MNVSNRSGSVTWLVEGRVLWQLLYQRACECQRQQQSMKASRTRGSAAETNSSDKLKPVHCSRELGGLLQRIKGTQAKTLPCCCCKPMLRNVHSVLIQKSLLCPRRRPIQRETCLLPLTFSWCCCSQVCKSTWKSWLPWTTSWGYCALADIPTPSQRLLKEVLAWVCIFIFIHINSKEPFWPLFW